MKNGKIFFLALGVFVFLAGGCSLFGGESGIQPEAALPEDSLMVVSIDRSDKDQSAKLKNLMEKFPKNGLGQKLIDQYNAAVADDQKFSVWGPVFKNEWKVVFGVKTQGESVEEISDKNLEFYLVGKFAEADKLETILDKELGAQKEDDGVNYWVNNDLFVTRSDEFFVMAQNVENMKSALDRLDDESGFNIEEKTAFAPGLAGGNLGYFYLNSENASSFAKVLEEELPGVESSLKGLGDMYMILTADKDNLRFKSHTLVNDSEKNTSMVTDYVPQLISKVPGMDMIMFAEQGSMETIFEAVYETLSIEAGSDPEAEVLKTIAAFATLEVDEVKAIVDSPVAFSMSYVDQLYPAMMLYLDLEKEEVEAAKKLALAFDQYVDEIMKSFDDLVALEADNVKGALKKAPVVVNGGGMHKAYLDWSAFKDEDLAALNVVPGINVKDLKVEFYYGVTGDNVMVFGLYPGFDKVYGEDVFAENEDFKKAEKTLDSGRGFVVSYFQTEPLLMLADKYFKVVQGMGMLKPQDEKTYEMIRKSVGTVQYIISTSKEEDNAIKGEGAVRIESVK